MRAWINGAGRRPIGRSHDVAKGPAAASEVQLAGCLIALERAPAG